MSLIRLVVFGFLILSVIYLVIAAYSRSVRREKLEDEWDRAHPGSADQAARQAAVDAGLKIYRRGLRSKLVFLVYVVPVVAITVILYLTNYT